MKKIGLIINPVAGVGGPAALKGSDGPEVQRLAKELGIRSATQERTKVVLKSLALVKEQVQLYAAPAEMGETAAREMGFTPTVVGAIESGATTAEDTVRIAKEMLALGLDLLLFAGGDGTARNVAEAVGTDLTVLGIPGGVKIHSAVYAKNPLAAAELALRFVEEQELETTAAEVMDIDEEKFRAGSVAARLYGYMNVLKARAFMQCCKSGGKSSAEALDDIATDVVEYMEDHPERLYVIGSGTTTRAVMEMLRLPDTLLGVDVVENGQVVASDVNEQQLYELVKGREATIVLTVIGGQGHILGRGNQQLSPRVLREVGLANLMIIADPEKLACLPGKALVVDSGDSELDRALCGWRAVVTGLGQTTMMKITV
ncbi:MAG: ATP-NAD kinase family protein [Oscillospiraceae bacterium]